MVKKSKKNRRKRSEGALPVGGESHNIPSFMGKLKEQAALGINPVAKPAKKFLSFLRAKRDSYKK